MADNVTFQSSTLATVPDATVVATDDAGAAGHVQIVKLAVSADGSATALTADNTDGLLVNLGTNNDVVVSDGGNSITVDGTFWQATQPVSIAAAVPVTDNGGSLTVDGTVAISGSVSVTSATVASATLANVSDSTTSQTLAASNASRKGLIIYNDSTATLYVKYGATASTTSFTVAIPGYGTGTMDAPVYTGVVDGIWSADTSAGAARVTEL